MTTRLRALGIDQLSIVERIALAQEILDSVAAEQPPPQLSESKRAELDRRLADCEANPSDEAAWEDVEAAAI